MKMVYFMLLILCMNISAGIFSYSLDSYKTQNKIGSIPSYDTNTLNEFGTRYNQTSFAPSILDDSAYKDPANSAFSDFNGYSFLDLIKRCLFLHVMLNSLFGLDMTLAVFISLPMYLFYIVTIVQLIFRVSGDSMT